MLKKNGKSKSEGIYEISTGRNPTARPYLNEDQFSRKRQRIEETLTEHEKKSIMGEFKKENKKKIEKSSVNVPESFPQNKCLDRKAA